MQHSDEREFLEATIGAVAVLYDLLELNDRQDLMKRREEWRSGMQYSDAARWLAKAENWLGKTGVPLIDVLNARRPQRLPFPRKEPPMPIIGPAIDMPPSAADRSPDATIERPWLKARYDMGLNAASGRMLARTIKGDMREYRFEVAFGGGGVRRATVSAGEAPNASDFDNRDGNPGFWEITGLPTGSREDLLDCARRIGVHLRDLAFEQTAMAGGTIRWEDRAVGAGDQIAAAISRRGPAGR